MEHTNTSSSHFQGNPMTTPTYDPKITAVLLVDPYNDFLSEGGDLEAFVNSFREDVGLLDNLRAILRAAREAGLGIFFVPHCSEKPLQPQGSDLLEAGDAAGSESQIFAKDT